MKISIIIPTYNRAEILERCLRHIYADAKTFPYKLEVIVVNDGSTDNTEELVKPFIKEHHLIYLKQKNKKQGAARNYGLTKVTGDVVVFIGDDIFIQPEFLNKTAYFHIAHPEPNAALLGRTTWHPELDINKYMLFLESSGIQFGYPMLQKAQKRSKAPKNKPWRINLDKPYRFFYTSNISLRSSVAKSLKFNEDFKTYGYEDIMYGKELIQKYGLKLYYQDNLLAYHYEQQDQSNLPKRMSALAQSAQIFTEAKPTGLKKIVYRFISLCKFDKLPLPYNLKLWLRAKRYFIEALTRFN